MSNQPAEPLPLAEMNGKIVENNTQEHKGIAFKTDGSISQNEPSFASAASQVTLPAWLNIGIMISLIFGGCCSNVFALEAIVKDEPESGILITFVQFFLTTALTYPDFISLRNPPFFIKPSAIPMGRMLKYIVLFFSVNALNNFAFGCKISVPVHIILRSGGSITTVVVGWISGKRYSPRQILGVGILTFGVILAALSDVQAKGKMDSPTPIPETTSSSATNSFGLGLFILLFAQTLSAVMGVYTENTYAKHGKHWRDTMFFSHLLSLPLFLPFIPSLISQYQILTTSPPLTSYITAYSPTTFVKFLPLSAASIPIKVFMLLLNASTQYACIRGVNMLAANTTSLGVTIVLNIRKLVSLLLSIWLFDNKLAPGVLVGAAFVFAGGSVYTSDNHRSREKSKKQEGKRLQ
ncbi:MAG: golgi uridine diphosphate-N- acetylglucosamine transporter [Cirrosporium novae-zelandiae]|nr:MAG: golgi uridine diphosphate-N- acetylglucosamine transporter [Cirrosporium novae-zelandiae]